MLRFIIFALGLPLVHTSKLDLIVNDHTSKLGLIVNDDATFDITLDGQPWLSGGEVRVGPLSSSAGTLVLASGARPSTGTDALFAGVPPFVHCRTSALPFGTASCDVLIDKGTLDALLCGGDDRRARELLAEASRCVREGGWFFSVTYAASGHPSNMGPPTHAHLQID